MTNKTPLTFNHTVVDRLFLRALGQQADVTIEASYALLEMLERCGKELATHAVEVARDSKRKTVKDTDVKEAKVRWLAEKKKEADLVE